MSVISRVRFSGGRMVDSIKPHTIATGPEVRSCREQIDGDRVLTGVLACDIEAFHGALRGAGPSAVDLPYFYRGPWTYDSWHFRQCPPLSISIGTRPGSAGGFAVQAVRRYDPVWVTSDLVRVRTNYRASRYPYRLTRRRCASVAPDLLGRIRSRSRIITCL
jgi:hypothetical protein